MFRRIAIPILISLVIPSCIERTEHGHDHAHADHDHTEHVHDHDHDHADHDHDHAHEHAGHEHAGDAHAENGTTGLIELDDATAERFGVVVDTLRYAPFTPAVRAAGTVLPAANADAVVSAPVAGIVHFASGIEPGRQVGTGAVVATIDASAVSGGNSGAAAKAALDAARTEYKRIEELYAEQLATVAERNAALAALRQAEAAYSPAATAGRATSPISGVITSLSARQGQYVGAGDVIATVSTDRDLTLRVDLPQRYYADAASYTDAVVTLPYGGGSLRLSDIGGKRTGASAMPAGSSTAYVPVYFSVPRHAGLAPGSSFTAHLIGGGTVQTLTVPATALSEQQGEYFVYESLGGGHYRKQRVDLQQSDGLNAAISGVAAGTPLVVKGVTTVRLAENGANIPEGHTHNH